MSHRDNKHPLFSIFHLVNISSEHIYHDIIDNMIIFYKIDEKGVNDALYVYYVTEEESIFESAAGPITTYRYWTKSLSFHPQMRTHEEICIGIQSKEHFEELKKDCSLQIRDRSNYIHPEYSANIIIRNGKIHDICAYSVELRKGKFCNPRKLKEIKKTLGIPTEHKQSETKQMIEELIKQVNILTEKVEELTFAPGGPEYMKAKSDFATLTHTNCH